VRFLMAVFLRMRQLFAVPINPLISINLHVFM
jgi:hypothetical protein